MEVTEGEMKTKMEKKKEYWKMMNETAEEFSLEEQAKFWRIRAKEFCNGGWEVAYDIERILVQRRQCGGERK